MSDTTRAVQPEGGPVSSDPGHAAWVDPEGPSRYAPPPVNDDTQPLRWVPPAGPEYPQTAPPAPSDRAKPPFYRRAWFVGLLGLIGGAIIAGTAASGSGKTTVRTVAGPTVTQEVPGPTVTQDVPGPTVTQQAPTPKPAPKPVSNVLLDRSGSGQWNSTQFQVGDGPLTVTYSYDGNSSFGGSGDNFMADIVSGSSDSLSVANDIAVSGGKTTTVYPDTSFGGSHSYHLEVTATGHWHFKITQG
jgi:hypothetical protein